MTRYLEPSTEPAEGVVAAVYRQMEEDLGLVVEPLSLHRPLPDLLAAAWATFRETVIVQEFLDREVKETIAVAVSRSNRCPYCVDSHSLFLHALGAGATEKALARGGRRRGRVRAGRGPDPGLLVFAAWAAATRTAAAADLEELPYTSEQAPEAIGTALAFHYVNRLVTPLLGESPLPSTSHLLRRLQLRVAGRRLAGRARAFHPRGTALDLLPEVELPGHLDWAAASPRIQAAFAALDAAVDGAVEGWIGAAARDRVLERLEGWRGEEMPPGEDWIDEAVAGLAPSQAAAARLALLAALAPYRVTEREVHAFRAHHPGDPPLVATLAWSAYQAARRIGSWLRTEVRVFG